MFCTKCGSKNQDDAVFCYNCGNRLNVYNPEQPQPQYNGMPTYPSTGLSSGTRHKRHILPWILSFAGLAVVSAVTAVILIFSKKDAVLDQLLSSLQSSLEAESLDFTLDITNQTDGGSSRSKYSGIIEYDLGGENIAFDINLEPDSESILYNGTGYRAKSGTVVYTEDITSQLKLLYDYYDQYKPALRKLTDADWLDALKKAGLSSYINEEEMLNCIKTLNSKLNDKAFYKKVCHEFKISREEKSALYTFDIDVPAFTEAVIDIFEPAIDYDIDELKSELLTETEYIDKLKLEITTADNRISAVSFTAVMTFDNGADQSFQADLAIKNYNKASLDNKKIKDMIAAITPIPEIPAAEDAAADTSGETNDSAVQLPTENITLDLLCSANGEQAPDYIQDGVNRFVADNPGYTVNITPVTSENYSNQLSTARAAGSSPDIFLTYCDEAYFNDIKNGYLYDLTDFMNQNNYKDRFMNTAIAQCTYDYRIYSVPVENTMLAGIYYNKQIFSEYGLSEPKTIEELEQVCDTLKANGITPFAFGNLDSFPGSIYYTYLALRKGGLEPFYAALDGTGTFEADSFLYAGEKLQQWAENGYFNPGFNTAGESYMECRSLFYDGTASMYLTGSWYYDVIKAEASEYIDNMGFFEFPAYSYEDSYSHIALGNFGGAFYSVSNNCEDPEGAFKLITYLVDDTAVNMNVVSGYLPPVKNYTPPDAYNQEILEIARNAPAVLLWYDQYLPYTVADTYRRNIHDLLDQNITPEEAAAAIQQEMQNYLNQN